MSASMRVTIIPIDTFCAVDSIGFDSIDMTSVPKDVHAVQWFGTWGEQEILDLQTGRIDRNEKIDNLDAYQAVLNSYWTIRNRHDAAAKEAINEQTIIEV
jgi:hypothetical protein